MKEFRNTKVRLKERLAKVEQETGRLELLEKEVLDTPDQQLSLTDPDARCGSQIFNQLLGNDLIVMMKSAKYWRCYNSIIRFDFYWQTRNVCVRFGDPRRYIRTYRTVRT